MIVDPAAILRRTLEQFDAQLDEWELWDSDPTEAFERQAEAFYVETGFMAPGKSVPLEMASVDNDAERCQRYQEWTQARKQQRQAMLRAFARQVADLLASLPVAPRDNNPHILGLDCSYSKAGETRRLLALAAPDEIVELTADNTAEVARRIAHADGLLIATPVHWFNVPWVLKKLIDAMDLEPGQWPFEDKTLGIITVCNEDGGELAALQILGPLLHMGFCVPPFSIVFHNSQMQGGEGNWQNDEIPLLVPRLREWVPLPVAPREEPVTACCAEPIAADRRFCPRCGYEARVIEGNTSPPDRREDYTPFLGKMRRVLILRAEKAEAEAQRLQALLAAPGDTPPISLDGSPRCADCGRSALDVEVNGHDLDCAAGGTPPPENSNRKENIMESVIIPAKTVVHIKGIPVTLAVDTIVETSYGNMSLLTGYHYAHLGQLELENAANVPPPESSHG